MHFPSRQPTASHRWHNSCYLYLHGIDIVSGLLDMPYIDTILVKTQFLVYHTEVSGEP